MDESTTGSRWVTQSRCRSGSTSSAPACGHDSCVSSVTGSVQTEAGTPLHWTFQVGKCLGSRESLGKSTGPPSQPCPGIWLVWRGASASASGCGCGGRNSPVARPRQWRTSPSLAHPAGLQGGLEWQVSRHRPRRHHESPPAFRVAYPEHLGMVVNCSPSFLLGASYTWSANFLSRQTRHLCLSDKVRYPVRIPLRPRGAFDKASLRGLWAAMQTAQCTMATLLPSSCCRAPVHFFPSHVAHFVTCE